MVKIIKEICAEKNIMCEGYSYDWILRLTGNSKTVFIYGYQFENNSATAQLICTDKCATSELLLSQNIPAVKHSFFMSPTDLQYIGVNGNWQRMLDLLQQHGRLVCKPNEGTGGMDVYLVASALDLERAVNQIFAHYKSMAICPFLEIDQEYRAILLDGKVKLIYTKQRPTIMGDGSSTLRQLALKYYQSHSALPINGEVSEEDAPRVLKAGEKFFLNWKHNLGLGASPEIITEPDLVSKLNPLALSAADAVNAQFASVDIIKTEAGYLVLEINSGVMMENFALSSDENFQLAKSIYRDALEILFK